MTTAIKFTDRDELVAAKAEAKADDEIDQLRELIKKLTEEISIKKNQLAEVQTVLQGSIDA